MENIVLQCCFIIGIILFFLVIFFFLRKNALSLQYALLWIFSVFIMLVISIFPGILTVIAKLLGFQVASNALFAIILGFVIIILLSVTSILSKQGQMLKTLAQTNALLEKRIRELEEITSD